MNSPVTVSAVITTFNRSGLITRAINSVLHQTYSAAEIVIVDDASTDDTEDVVRSLELPQLRYVKLQFNSGPQGAINAGLDAATGDLIAFLDSDDEWLPNKLQRQVNFYSRADDPHRLLVGSRLLISGEGVPDRIRPKSLIKTSESVADYLFTRDGLLQTSTLMVSADIAKRIRFHSDHRVHTDIGFCLRLEAAAVKVEMCPEVLCVWSDDNPHARVSTNSAFQAQERWLASFAHLLSRAQERGFRARLLFPFTVKRSKRAALLDSYRAWRSNAISTPFLISNLARAFLSNEGYWRLRKIVSGFRHSVAWGPRT